MFFKNDFADLGQADAIDKALSRLAKAGRIRRVLRGLYDYPKFSSFLKKELGANVDQVAHALARKFGFLEALGFSFPCSSVGMHTVLST